MFTKLVRIGRDTEVRVIPGSGKSVATVVAVFDVGIGEKKHGSWIEGALWEKRAIALAPYLKKGQQAVITYDDLEAEVYEHNGKHKPKLKARIVDVQLCGSKQESSQPAQQQAPQQQAQAQQAAPPTDDEFGDDIPFS